METKKRYRLFLSMLSAFDLSCEYVNEYNSLLHDYNGVVLYQAESQFINKIGTNPGITITELATLFKKTPSACSQLMRRMKNKGWLYQQRNQENNREFKLFLTEKGETIYTAHKAFEKTCYLRTLNMLQDFSDEELEIYTKIQLQLGKSFALDTEESRHISGNTLADEP